MSKYAYPAVFTLEEDGTYSIIFPDLEGCYTCGDSLEDGIEMAEDALALTLYGYEKEGREIPKASVPTAITVSENEFVNFIACDTMAYRKMYNNKAVKKNAYHSRVVKRSRNFYGAQLFSGTPGSSYF